MPKTLSKNQIMKTLQRDLPRLREKYGVVKFGLYGSFAKGKAKRTSDVDLLVEFEKPIGWEFVDLADELEKALGRKVDVATFSAWKRTFDNPRRRSIAEDVERTLIYVQ